MTFETDIPGIVSENLAAVIEAILNHPENEQPPRLGSVLNAINHGIVHHLVEERILDIEEGDNSILLEINGLIESYGADRLALDFIRYRASDNLAIVINALLNQYEDDQPATLATVLEEMNQGLVSRLVGIGDIDPDEDETLFSEIQRLIRSHGEDAPAEDFLP
jgi:hypothetical protein